VILIFSEVTPKTLAALHPEAIAYPAAYVYTVLLKVLQPVVVAVAFITNGLLRLLGVRADAGEGSALSREELRTVVIEAGAMIPERSRDMLIAILDLENAVVEDIMIPRNDVEGIDLQDPPDEIVAAIKRASYTRLPLFDGGIDNVVGIFHTRNTIGILEGGEDIREKLRAIARPPYFVPEGTRLYRQLIAFQRVKRRVALVVDEYGDFQGLITLADLLEEIVGEFTTDPADAALGGYQLEIVQTTDNAVRSVRVRPPARQGRHPLPRRTPPRWPRRVASPARPRALEAAARRVRRRHDGAPEAVLRRLPQSLLAIRHGPDLPGQPHFAERHQSGRQRPVAQAAKRREQHRQIRRGLDDTHAADDIDEHVLVEHRDARVPVHDGQQQRQAIRVEPDRHAARVARAALVDQRLDLHEQGAAALARHHDRAARHAAVVTRQENRRRVQHLAQALAGHREDADLVGRAEAVLDGADDPEAAAEIAFEVQHRIDHVLEHARPGDGAVLGHVADQEHRRTACLA
jgi:Mg2+/Co2+ transporter CorC